MAVVQEIGGLSIGKSADYSACGSIGQVTESRVAIDAATEIVSVHMKKHLYECFYVWVNGLY